jgi:hypothetical protein
MGAATVSESNHVQPYVLAVLLCDSIIIEEGSGKKTLVGLFERIFAPGFPALHRFGIYVKMVDAEGTYPLRIDYVDLSNDRIVERLPLGNFEANDRLQATELVMNIIAPIPAQGTYEFRIFASDFYLARATFRAEVLEPQGGLKP